MNKAFERSAPHVNLTSGQIQKCVDSFASDIQVKDYYLASSGLANTNYIVTLSDNQKVVLRVHANTSNKGNKEFKLAEILATVPQVPKILYFHIANDNDFSYSITEFIPGIILSEINNSENVDNVYFEIGEMLAKLKAIKFQHDGLLGDKLEIIPIKTKHKQYHPIINFVLDCLEDSNFARRVNSNIMEAIKELIIQNNSLLFSTAEESHLVHGDFKHENIMVQSSSDRKMHLSGVLDWEHARSGTTYEDIATLFRGDYSKNSNHKLAFYQGFTKNGTTLIQDWDKACKIIDLVNICDFLCEKDERPNLFEAMINHLKEIINYCK